MKVSKRLNCPKTQSWGIFTTAKCVRGPDWDWGNQDGNVFFKNYSVNDICDYSIVEVHEIGGGGGGFV